MELYYNKFTKRRINFLLNSRYGVIGNSTMYSPDVKIYQPKEPLHICNDYVSVIEYKKVRDWRNTHRKIKENTPSGVRMVMAYVSATFILGSSMAITGAFIHLVINS